MVDMFDSLPDGETKPASDLPESEKAVAVTGASPSIDLTLTMDQVILACGWEDDDEEGDDRKTKPESILAISNDDMEIRTPEQRLIANELMGQFKTAENKVKTWEALNVAPKKASLKELTDEIKPFKNKLVSLINNVKKATKKWDLKIAQEARAEQQAEVDRIEAERAKAVKEMLANKKKGEKSPVETLEKVKMTAPPVGSVKVETAQGTSSGKLGKVWFIIKTDGTEWDKKSRLPLLDVKGLEIPLDDSPGIAFGCVDTVQINDKFKIDQGKEFPKWIQTREEIINNKFNL